MKRPHPSTINSQLSTNLRAPFPWFGGKSRCAHLVWERFGDVPNYVEPFFGSGAVLLARPHAPRAETVNDKDCYVANFWRCFTAISEWRSGVSAERRHSGQSAAVCRRAATAWAEIAHYADWPRNECDLHARHQWLVNQPEWRERMMTDPGYFDAKIAGWWVWGICQWIGEGWCAKPEWAGRGNSSGKPRGIHAQQLGRGDGQWQTRPHVSGGMGVHRKMPELSRSGNGVHRKRMNLHRGAVGVHRTGGGDAHVAEVLRRGVAATHRSLPIVGGDGSGSGRGIHAQYIRDNLFAYMAALADRLRRTVVCCGDFERILGPAPTTCIGLTGVFLDPPYGRGTGAGRDAVYSCEDFQVAIRARKWALANGDNPKLRIALCGYEGEHRMPKRWTCVTWKANGGYGNQTDSRGRANALRERIWFSPHCLKPQDLLL